MLSIKKPDTRGYLAFWGVSLSPCNGYNRFFRFFGKRDCIQITVSGNCFCHIHTVGNDLMRIFFGDPANCSCFMNHKNIHCFRFADTLNSGKTGVFVHKTEAGAVHTLGKDYKPGIALRCRCTPIARMPSSGRNQIPSISLPSPGREYPQV